MLLQTLAVQDRPLSGKSRQPRNYRLAVSWTSSPRNFDIVTDTGPAVPAPRPHGRRDPWLRSGSEDGMTLPLAGRPGHGPAPSGTCSDPLLTPSLVGICTSTRGISVSSS